MNNFHMLFVIDDSNKYVCMYVKLVISSFRVQVIALEMEHEVDFLLVFCFFKENIGNKSETLLVLHFPQRN